MAETAVDVVAVTPHVTFSHEGAGKSDAKLAADLICPKIVWENVGGGRDKGRSLEDDNVGGRDEFYDV